MWLYWIFKPLFEWAGEKEDSWFRAITAISIAMIISFTIFIIIIAFIGVLMEWLIGGYTLTESLSDWFHEIFFFIKD